uniref:Uncharacterized protein n=1 Tax=Cacopsylla melanoneura TaxID=428564 RepID=A0A8D9EWG2_9HEMI
MFGVSFDLFLVANFRYFTLKLFSLCSLESSIFISSVKYCPCEVFSVLIRCHKSLGITNISNSIPQELSGVSSIIALKFKGECLTVLPDDTVQAPLFMLSSPDCVHSPLSDHPPYFECMRLVGKMLRLACESSTQRRGPALPLHHGHAGLRHV